MTSSNSIKFFNLISYDKDNWREHAACKTNTPATFYLEENDKKMFSEVRKICNNCPVKQECLDYAIENTERFGIWGGLGYRSRLKYAKQNKLINEM